MANGYINIDHLYKRMPVLTDTNGDHLIAVSDLRTAIALAAAETGEVHPLPCEIGSKIYEVTGEPGEQIDIFEHTVSEVGLVGVFIHGGILGLRHRHYFAYEDEGVWWFFRREDAEAERKRRDDP